MAEHEHASRVDRAPPGDDTIAANPLLVHAEVGRAVQREHVELGERSRIEQPVDPLARGELALGVLRALCRATAVHRIVATLAQQVDLALGGAALAAKRDTVTLLGTRANLGRVEGRGIARANRRHALSRCPGHDRRLPAVRRAAGSVHNALDGRYTPNTSRIAPHTSPTVARTRSPSRSSGSRLVSPSAPRRSASSARSTGA